MKSDMEHSDKKFLALIAAGFVTVFLSALPGCSRHTETVSAAVTGQTSFSTAEAAGHALRAASKAHDETALTAILGSPAKAILNSGDPFEDKESLDSFVSQYDRMNRWATMIDGSQILYIGPTNYPFPIPLVRNSSATWQFDAKAGEDEILARRIGRNELLAIDACYAVARAEQQYFKSAPDGNPAHRYTEKIISTPGKQDGLYWPVPGDQPASPLGRVEEFAKDSVEAAYAGAPPVFDGYVFRVLSSPQGGFTVIASPAKYGDSGIMTFVLGRDGRVQQNDRGPDASQRAASGDTYNPSEGWTPAE